MKKQRATEKWAGQLLVDSGDTFVPNFSLADEAMRKNVVATAEFIVDQYNEAGFHGMTLGDRDLLLGAKALGKLAKRAKFPVLVANLVDKASGKALFEATAVHTVAGRKIGVFGVTGESPRLPPESTLKVTPYLPAAKAAVKALQAKNVDIIVALSHLSDRDQKALAKAVPQITAILGGQTVRMQKSAEVEAKTFITTAFSKGKYIGVLQFNLHKGTTTPGVFVDRFASAGLQQKLTEVSGRLARYQKMLERQKNKPPPAAATRPGAPKRPNAASRTSFYEKQITKLRAEQQLLEMQVQDTPAVDAKANFIKFELVPLGKAIEHDATIDAAIAKLRKTVPSLAKKPKRPSSVPPRLMGPRKGATPHPRVQQPKRKKGPVRK